MSFGILNPVFDIHHLLYSIARLSTFKPLGATYPRGCTRRCHMLHGLHQVIHEPPGYASYTHAAPHTLMGTYLLMLYCEPLLLLHCADIVPLSPLPIHRCNMCPNGHPTLLPQPAWVQSLYPCMTPIPALRQVAQIHPQLPVQRAGSCSWRREGSPEHMAVVSAKMMRGVAVR